MIHLVGAGPGDPGLLTVRGRDLLAVADTVIFDALVAPEIIALARDGAERIPVGKRACVGSVREGWHTETIRGEGAVTQDRINELLVRLGSVRPRDTIVRLKGGDPFLFGRGGEEAAHLAAAGISFEVVPGVSSAIAAAAYAGIPVTHRGSAHSLSIVTGSRDADAALSDRELDALVKLGGTIVFLMAMSRLAEISSRLVTHGLSSATPVAVVQWGSRPGQRTVTGTLETIAGLVLENRIGPPAVVVVGEVVSLRETLSWFETRPLFGRRVVVTATAGIASRMGCLLASRGADVVESPAVAIHPLPTEALDGALRSLDRYTDLLITSRPAARILGERMESLGIDARVFARMRVVAIGPSTAAALKTATGLKADLVPKQSDAEGLIAALGETAGRLILQPRALVARDLLESRLGASLEVIPVYEAKARRDSKFAELFASDAVDAVVCCSASAVASLSSSLVADERASLSLGRAIAVAIGPATAAALRSRGVNPIVAETASIDAVVDAVIRSLTRPLAEPT